MVGYYNDYKDNGKTMNFKLDYDSLNKIYDIFEHIEKKKVDLSDFTYQGRFEEYLKMKVSNETCFRKDKDNKTIIPNENTKYDCRVLLQIQSVYYSVKDKDILSDENVDIVYYIELLLEQCRHRHFSNNKLIQPDLIFTNSEPDDNDEFEEEFNEDTVFDE